ncbi:MAG: TRAP transporter small permease [Rhodospirillales bacterium]|nr:TRAP transporter small permease [Rhodospirillales bacterium]
MFTGIRRAFERLLEAIVIVLVVAMSAVVIAGIVFRTAGESLVWYDEVASILLAWLTYYGAALAAFRRAHIGVPGVVATLRPPLRAAMFVLAEALVIGFFALLTWTGWTVVEVLEGSYLVSLPEVSVPFTQSVIPIGAILFILAQLASMPDAWRKTMAHTVPARGRNGAQDLASTE